MVLAKRNGGAPVFVAAEQAQTVLNRLRAIPPRAGKWGAYWWLTTNFMPVETDDEEIF